MLTLIILESPNKIQKLKKIRKTCFAIASYPSQGLVSRIAEFTASVV